MGLADHAYIITTDLSCFILLRYFSCDRLMKKFYLKSCSSFLCITSDMCTSYFRFVVLQLYLALRLVFPIFFSSGSLTLW